MASPYQSVWPQLRLSCCPVQTSALWWHKEKPHGHRPPPPEELSLLSVRQVNCSSSIFFHYRSVQQSQMLSPESFFSILPLALRGWKWKKCNGKHCQNSELKSYYMSSVRHSKLSDVIYSKAFSRYWSSHFAKNKKISVFRIMQINI